MIKLLTAITMIGIAVTCAIMLMGCDSDSLCDRGDYPNAPAGYWQQSKYSEGEYISVTYTNGSHWVTWTSVDECDDWEKSSFWSN